ncbi:valine--tRNA ligase [Orbilia ellipsospora]|uniref:valine--tRNA ligase n=1 Tax=Orbilia ellipsospora TaxID=2528407 RepID=A0AAV9XM39_9PEZI
MLVMQPQLIASSYKPKDIEQKWYVVWEREGYFGHTTQRHQMNTESMDGIGNGSRSTVKDLTSATSSDEVSVSDTTSDSDTLRASSGILSIKGRLDGRSRKASNSSDRMLKNSQKGVFTMFTPPPNITGALHCGHALAISLEDTLVRWHRMRGFETLFIPGCDHAGIATQVLVEKKAIREKQKNRHELGQIRFSRLLEKWKDEHHTKITTAFKRLGASMDWTLEAFTMDEARKEAVTEAFVRLHEQGVIYRAEKITNWCSTLRTAISDLEIDILDVSGPKSLEVPGHSTPVEFGILYYLKYVIVLDDHSVTWIEMATTRPEILLADTALAVHPDDHRYSHLIGSRARHPYSCRLLPIVGDYAVDRKFGTGVLNVAPGHDQLGFAIGKRNGLEAVVVYNDEGMVNKNGGDFCGQKRFEVRAHIIEDLKERGLFIKQSGCKVKIPICNRTGDVVEPVLRPQWWMKMSQLAPAAAKALRDGMIEVRPESMKEKLLESLDYPQDWCLSTQIWWGHEIPVWHLTVELERDENDDFSMRAPQQEDWIVARSEGEALQHIQEKYLGKKWTLNKDTEVLDTWFSAALWPFAILGWPKKSEELKTFFPASILDTGADTLNFWVTRMIMLSLKLTGRVPFREVYFHPLIRDLEGRKMSKSIGNVIDPVDVIEGSTLTTLHQKLLEGNLTPNSDEIERTKRFQTTCFPKGIPECGADALRFALVNYASGRK